MAKKDSVEDLELEKPVEVEKKKLPRPSVGRVVHFHPEDNSKPIAAVVTETSDSDPYLASISMFDPRGEVRGKLNVPFSEEPGKGHHWNWPPKV